MAIKDLLEEDEKKVRAELKESRAELVSLRGQVQNEGETISQLQLQLDQSKTELSEEREARRRLEERIKVLEQVGGSARPVRRFVMKSLAGLIIAFTLTAIVTAISRPSLGFWVSTAVVWFILFPLWAWLVGRYGKRNPAVEQWGHFSRFRKATITVWVIIGWVMVWNVYEAVGTAAISWLKSLLKH